MSNIGYEKFDYENRLKLFGHEDAVQEDEQRLSTFFYKKSQYDEVTSNAGFQVITGEKGTGKSALIKMACIQEEQNGRVPIRLRLDDLAEIYGEILECNKLYALKLLWKKAIAKVIVMKIASKLHFSLSDDKAKVLTWAYEYGYAEKDFITQCAEKFHNTIKDFYDSEEKEYDKGEYQILKRLIGNKQIRLFLDDFDLDWKGSENDILIIKSLIISLIDMTSDIKGLSARIALRTDVYEMIRNEEFSDKIESATIKCLWNNQELIVALAKRICAFNGDKFDSNIERNPADSQFKVKYYLNSVFESYFPPDIRYWGGADTSKVIYALLRRKPRDIVKLCLGLAKYAYDRKKSKIDYECFYQTLDLYSSERLKDLVNEYKNQMTNLEKVLVRMAPTKKEIANKASGKYVYTTTELIEKIKNIKSNISIMIYSPQSNQKTEANQHDIAHFLYKIGFITGRKNSKTGKINRVYYDEAPSLLLQNVGDNGFNWEIHVSYRAALAKGISDMWQNTLNITEE